MRRVPKWLTKGLLVAGLGVLVVVLMLYLAGSFSAKVPAHGRAADGTEPIGGASLVEARLIELPATELAPGSIQPLHETSLASKVREPEKVLEVKVTAGQQVHKGDLLVLLDSSTWLNRKELAEAKLRSAQVAHDDAQRNLKRIQAAFDKDVATAAELDTARYREASTQSELVAAQRALDEAVMNLGYTKITAPMDAVVIDKRVDAGDTVSPGQPLVRLYDKMQLIANVREGLMQHLKIGQEIGVYVGDVGASCTGTISEIVPQADPATRTFQVKVVGDCHAGVRPGMYARLVVPLGMRKVLVIPAPAVEQVGQLTMVRVAAGDLLERRSVQLGKPLEHEGKPLVQVLSGLTPGEKVAVPAAATSAATNVGATAREQ